jgi:hypothetical protein
MVARVLTSWTSWLDCAVTDSSGQYRPQRRGPRDVEHLLLITAYRDPEYASCGTRNRCSWLNPKHPGLLAVCRFRWEEFLLHRHRSSECVEIIIEGRSSVARETSNRLLVIFIAALLLLRCFLLHLFLLLLLFLYDRSSNTVQVSLAILRDPATPVWQQL